jgi:hypothetical protein
MKKFLGTSVLYALIAVAVTVASLIFLLMVFAGIATLLGNLAFWPLIADMLFGLNLTQTQMLLISALMLAVIVCGFLIAPDRSENILEMFGALIVCGIIFSMLIAIFGVPIFLLIKYVVGINLPKWAVLPIGVATFVIGLGLSSLFSKVTRESS